MLKHITRLCLVAYTALFVAACGSTRAGMAPASEAQPAATVASTVAPSAVPTAPPPTAVPTRVPTAVPTEAPTAVPAPTIKTPQGELVLTRFEAPADEFMAQRAAPGYQIVLVWFKSLDGKVDAMEMFDMHEGVYLIGADGSRTESIGGGMEQGELVIAFTPPDTATDFTLEWPDNPPLKLER